ncbi:MAG: tetratricopeptide repeat protein [Elusimicrobiaceae bacterium]|nr:tetratricopeptide repeat protein [Elusimicrobiaceae bacterium]
MILLKSKSYLLMLCLLFSALHLQAGLFGIHLADRKEYVQARETFDQGQYEQAVTLLTDYIYKTQNIKRREARAYRLLGLAYEQLNNPGKALETYKEALEFHDKNVPLLLAAASLYRRSDLLEQSVNLYERALMLEPENTAALSGLAENYISMGFYSKAQALYEQLSNVQPQLSPIERARQAYTFFKQRKYEQAFVFITMAKLQEPENADFWLLSARTYKGLSMLTDALAELDIAILLAPQKNELKDTKAIWLYQAQQYNQALALAEEILQRSPRHEPALLVKAFALQKMGKKQTAQQILMQIKNMQTDSFTHRVASRLLEK